MDSKVFVEIVATALSMDMPLDRIAVRILDYYNRLCHEIDLRLRPGFASQEERVLYHRNRCCKAVLFKSLFRYLVLSWLKFKNLAIVITSPRRNQSFYAHRRLNKLLMLDFGGINGFEEIYPRSLDCMLYGKQVVSLNDLSRRMYECLWNADLSQYKLLSELIEPSLHDSLAEA